MGDLRLTTEELLKLAISIEQEGILFYTDLAKNQEPEVKDFLLKLSKDEKQHEAIFTKWLNNLSESNDNDYLYDENVTILFRSIADEIEFSGRKKNKELTLLEALDLGIETEEISIKFYEELLEYAKEEMKPLLEKIIAEEKSHKTRLESYLNKLT